MSQDQDYKVTVLRKTLALTDTYVYYELDDKQLQNQIIFNIDYTKGSSDAIYAVIETSTDGTTWRQDNYTTTAIGVSTVYDREYTRSTAGSMVIAFPSKYRHIRVGVKATGADLTGAKAYVEAINGVA